YVPVIRYNSDDVLEYPDVAWSIPGGVSERVELRERERHSDHGEGALVQPVATALRNRDSVAWRIRVTPEFSIHDVQQRARHTLVLAGDLEMTNAPILATVIARLCTDGASEIVLDLGELRFIDSTGLGSIVTGRAVCQ